MNKKLQYDFGFESAINPRILTMEKKYKPFYIDLSLKTLVRAVAPSDELARRYLPTAQSGLKKLSDSFMDNVNALLQLRNRLQDGEVFIDRFLCDELKETIGYKSNRPNLHVLPAILAGILMF